MLSPGTRVDGYRVERLLGQGGMGVVYEARQVSLDRRVALKVLAPGLADEPGFRERFRREALVQAKLTHPHAVPVYESGESEHGIYIAMQFIEGRDLRSLLAWEQPRPAELVGILGQVAAALDAAHDVGLVHRDVKPHNVLVDERGDAYLADFGLGRGAGHSLTQTGDFMGTVHYVSPEQIEGGDVGPAADVYSLGCVVFECLTGHVPYSGAGPAVLYAHVSATPPRVTASRPELPEAVDQVVAWALAKRPEERPPSASALIDALAAALAEDEQPAEAPVPRLRSALPPQLEATGPFVGREDALAALDDMWRAARRGETRLVTISGEAGVGKSRLTAAFARQVADDGGRVLFGRCYEESLTPYQPFAEAVGRWLETGAPETLGLVADTAAAELARLVPDLRNRIAGLREPLQGDPDGARFRLFEAVGTTLAASAERKPLLLILEDLHWIDKPSALMLRHVAEAIAGTPCLVLATIREGEANESAEAVLEEIRRTGRLAEHALAGLSRTDVEELAELTLGQSADSDLVSKLHDETAGNAFFATEVLRQLADDIDGGDAWTVPRSVRAAVERRLSQFGDDVQRVLTTAAVLGREFELGPVADVAGDSEDSVLDALEAVGAARLIEEVQGAVERWTFAHALVRETLLARLSATRCARIHRRAALALESRGATAAELAYHWLGSGDPKAGEYSRLAAEEALAQLAYEAAAHHYDRALEFAPQQSPLRAALMVGRGEAELRAGMSDDAVASLVTAAELAQAVADYELMTRAVLGAGRALSWGSMQDPGNADAIRIVALHEAALAALDPAAVALRSRLLASTAIQSYFMRSWGEKDRMSREAVELARESGEDAVIAYALNARHYSRWGPADPLDQLECATDMLHAAEAAGDLELTTMAHVLRAVDMLSLGDRVGAERELANERALAERLRQPRRIHLSRTRESMLALIDGRLDEAKDIVTRIAAEVRGGDANDVFLVIAVQTLAVSWLEGRLGDLEPLIAQNATSQQGVHAWQAGLAWAQAASGKGGEARATLDRLAEDGFKGFPLDTNFELAATLITQTMCELRAPGHARALYERLAPRGGRVQVLGHGGVCLGPVAAQLGLLAGMCGDLDAALFQFDVAARINASLGAPLSTAMTDLFRSEVLVDHRRRAEAVAACTRALPVLEASGAHGLVKRAHELLRTADVSEDEIGTGVRMAPANG